MAGSPELPATICTVTVRAAAAASSPARRTRPPPAAEPEAVIRHVFHSPLPPELLAPRLVKVIDRFLARQAGAIPRGGRGSAPVNRRPGLY